MATKASKVLATASRTQPKGMEVSQYMLRTLKQQAVMQYFERLYQNGDLSLSLETEEVDGVVDVKISVIENTYNV